VGVCFIVPSVLGVPLLLGAHGTRILSGNVARIRTHQRTSHPLPPAAALQIAWVDTPNKAGKFHRYAECSGKGICDRGTGQCACFEGFGGKGCQRMNCPGGCSGHGTCEYMEELAFGAVPGLYWGEKSEQELATDAKTFSDAASHLWDNHKSMACVCDPGFTDVDCSRRMCPKSNDVMNERNGFFAQSYYQTQNITLYGAGPSGNGTNSVLSDFYNKSFALTFKSTNNESFTTIPLYVMEKATTTATEAALRGAIKVALKSLPNKVITDVDVGVTLGYEQRAYASAIAFLNLVVEFTGASTMGPQNLLVVEAAPCGTGCTPQLTGLKLMSTAPNGTLSFVKEQVASDFQNYECGRRGKCDYGSGVCDCFAGFTGEACTVQTALI